MKSSDLVCTYCNLWSVVARLQVCKRYLQPTRYNGIREQYSSVRANGRHGSVIYNIWNVLLRRSTFVCVH